MNKATSTFSVENEKIIFNAINDCIRDKFDDIEFVDLDIYNEYGKLNLNILIWKKSGISLNDCEAVHNVISLLLDEYDNLFEKDYVLNVSSQGLDRKIVTNDDLRRALDSEIECVDSNKNKCHGKLISFDDDTIVIEVAKKQQTLLRKNLIKVQPFVRF